MGGAERAVVTLAEEFAKRQNEVTVMTWNSLMTDFYEVPPSIARRHVVLPQERVFVPWFHLYGNFRRARAIRRAVDATRPDVVLSFQDGTNELFLLSSAGAKYLRIVSCQNNITRREQNNTRWRVLRKWVYGKADRVVFLDQQQADAAQKTYPRWKCDGIPNPLPSIETAPDTDARQVLETIRRFDVKLVAMGRLAHQKGFDLLLSSFAALSRDVVNVGLVILGEGPLRCDLEAWRDELGLADKVVMPGNLKRPHAVIAACDIFVFSSRYEGQGLALAEAMACGVPPVSFDCPSGPDQMIKHDVNGLLVPPENVEALSSSMRTLVLDESRRRALGYAAAAVKQKYAPQSICNRWEVLFKSLRGERGEKTS